MSGRLIVAVVLSPLANDLALQEGAARYAVAKFRGLETRAAGDARVNGKTVGDCRVGPSGAKLVPLDGFAAAMGIEVARNKTRGTAAFTVDGTQFVYPLGANKLKKGSRWLACDDTLSWFDGHWYAPLDLLQV